MAQRLVIKKRTNQTERLWTRKLLFCIKFPSNVKETLFFCRQSQKLFFLYNYFYRDILNWRTNQHCYVHRVLVTNMWFACSWQRNLSISIDLLSLIIVILQLHTKVIFLIDRFYIRIRMKISKQSLLSCPTYCIFLIGFPIKKRAIEKWDPTQWKRFKL